LFLEERPVPVDSPREPAGRSAPVAKSAAFRPKRLVAPGRVNDARPIEWIDFVGSNCPAAQRQFNFPNRNSVPIALKRRKWSARESFAQDQNHRAANRARYSFTLLQSLGALAVRI
jgi:hypothetical protein